MWGKHEPAALHGEAGLDTRALLHAFPASSDRPRADPIHRNNAEQVAPPRWARKHSDPLLGGRLKAQEPLRLSSLLWMPATPFRPALAGDEPSRWVGYYRKPTGCARSVSTNRQKGSDNKTSFRLWLHARCDLCWLATSSSVLKFLLCTSSESPAEAHWVCDAPECLMFPSFNWHRLNGVTFLRFNQWYRFTACHICLELKGGGQVNAALFKRGTKYKYHVLCKKVKYE